MTGHSSVRRTTENFRKRKNSLMRKASDLHQLYDADVFVLFFRRGKYYVLTSADDGAWPPTFEQVVRLLALCYCICEILMLERVSSANTTLIQRSRRRLIIFYLE